MKFRVNDNVVVRATGEQGVVVSRDNRFDEATQRSTVTYVVKFGDSLKDFKEFSRKELKRVQVEPTYPKYNFKVYDGPNGYKLTMVGVTDIICLYNDILEAVNDVIGVPDGYETPATFKCKELNIGFAIYNPEDEYDVNTGVKIARHRALNSPFCHLTADFLGEFNEATVNALLDVKAQYILDNFDRFVSGPVDEVEG